MGNLQLQLVIMAAGMGSRYGGLKQIDEFGPANAFLMDYAIYDAMQVGVRQICVVVRETFRAAIQDRLTSKWAAHKDLQFKFVCQDGNDLPAGFTRPEGREKPWGTAHVLYVLKNHIQTPFFIMNADDFYGRPAIRTLTDFLKKNPTQHALAGYPLNQTLSPNGPVTRGVCDVEGGQLKGVDEVQKIMPDDRRTTPASMNLWAFAPTIFPAVEDVFAQFLKANSQSPTAEYQIPHAINDLVRTGRLGVSVLPVESTWFGVTYREDKDEVQNKIAKLVARGEYPQNLFVETPK